MSYNDSFYDYDPTTLACPLSLEARRNTVQLFEDLNDVNITARFYAPIPPSDSTKIVLIFFMSLIMAIGLIANIAVILWISKKPTKHSTSDVYIVTLAVGDLLTVFTRIPLHIDLLSNDFNFNCYSQSIATVLCKGGAYVQTAFLSVSVLTLVVIALDRYVAICHPIFHYSHIKNKRIYPVIATVFIWVLGAAIGISDCLDVSVIVSNFEDIDIADYGYTSPKKFFDAEVRFVLDEEHYRQHNELLPAPHKTECGDLRFFSVCTSDTEDEFVWYLFFLLYVLPLAVMAFCYLNIVHRLWIRKSVGVTVDSLNAVTKSNVTKRRSSVIMITLVATFGALWLPFWCSQLYLLSQIEQLNESTEAREFDQVDFAATIVSYLPILSSPIIYMVMDREFRNVMSRRISQLVSSLKKVCCKRYTEPAVAVRVMPNTTLSQG